MPLVVLLKPVRAQHADWRERFIKLVGTAVLLPSILVAQAEVVRREDKTARASRMVIIKCTEVEKCR